MNRNLDGYYFRVQRNNKWESICFSDLTEEEMESVLNTKDNKWLKSLCKGLGQRLKCVGNQLDIINK